MRFFITLSILLILVGCGRVPVAETDLPVTRVVGPDEAAPAERPEVEANHAESNQASEDNQQESDVDENSQAPAGSETAVDEVELTDEQWKSKLTAEEYHVLREKGTERAFTGKYDKHFEKGYYVCAGCGLVLFESDTKFNSGCGWPAFYASKAEDRVKLTPDFSFGWNRTEVTCARCDGHLGHIFDDAPQTPTGQRYCINSVSIKFVPAEFMPKDAKIVDIKAIEAKMKAQMAAEKEKKQEQ